MGQHVCSLKIVGEPGAEVAVLYRNRGDEAAAAGLQWPSWSRWARHCFSSVRVSCGRQPRMRNQDCGLHEHSSQSHERLIGAPEHSIMLSMRKF